MRYTRARLRTHAGKLAVPVRLAHGHQLAARQAPTFGDGSLFRFRVSSARLTAHARHVVTRLAPSMSTVSAITCEGYADFGHTGLHAHKRLSTRRAVALCKALASQTELTTTARGYAATRPVLIGGTNRERMGNRRVVLVVDAVSGSGMPPPSAPVPSAPTIFAASTTANGSTYGIEETFNDPPSDCGLHYGNFTSSIDGCSTAPITLRVRAVNANGPGASSAPCTFTPTQNGGCIPW